MAEPKLRREMFPLLMLNVMTCPVRQYYVPMLKFERLQSANIVTVIISICGNDFDDRIIIVPL